LDHVDHKKIPLEKGLEKKRSEIEIKLLEVEENGTRLMKHKAYLEKRRLKVDNSFEKATKIVHETAETCINLIRQHKESVTEQLIKQKGTFHISFGNEMTRLDGKLTEIRDSLEFGREVLSRENLPEILNVEQLLERRFRELSTPFIQMLDLTVVEYTPHDVSSLITFPGELFTSNTEPSSSVAEGKGLTEALKGEKAIFTITTKDSKSQTTYSEIDQINVEIISKTNETLKTTITDYKNGHYQVMYSSNEAGEFNVSITVRGEAIKDSPFRLTVTEKTATGLSGSASGGASRETECPICLDTLTNPRILKCKHVFCTKCAETALKHNNRCPVCKEVQGVIQGNQPEGEMRFKTTYDRLPGYYDCGTIVIYYSFQSGIQGPEHPNPGRFYDGTRRSAYLPDNREGREVLQLLRRAFEARLVFTVGTSVRTLRPS